MNKNKKTYWHRRDFLKSISAAAATFPFMGLDKNPSLLSPKVKEVLNMVPQPVLPGRPDLIEMYKKCWALGLKNSEHGTDQNGFVDWYIDASFDNRIFQWDTCFALAWAKYSQGSLPNIKSLDNFYRKQHSDGAISGVIRKKDGTDDQPEDAPWFTRNNLFSWAEWENYKITGDDSRFERVIPILKNYARWIRKNRRHDNGHFFWSGWSSGMDNSPRSRANKFYPPYSWIDYDANEALAAYYLIKMAEVIGDKQTVRQYRQIHNHITKLVNRDMWSEEDRFYWDLDKDGSFMKVKTVASFWPLWGRVARDRQVEGLIYHLKDADSFNRPHRVPTLAADNKSYASSGRYWRGSVWAPTNHMIVKGLQANNRHKLARDIVLNHLNNMSAVFQGTQTVWENYAPEFTKPGKPAQPDFVGWSADGPIAQLIENYIGINIDVPNNKIRWNLLTTEEVGLKNLEFGESTIEVIAKERNKESDPITVEIETQHSFDLELFNGDHIFKRSIKPSDHTITFGNKS